jgi:uncharacterized protein YdhG (YjbR/CyaY superfamily)
MVKTAFRSVDEYLASQPEATRAVLERVRSAIRKALPRAEELISYQIPAYKLDGACVIYFAGWKRHFSLYPVTGRVLEEMAEELAPYEISKGTIRFPLSEPVPVRLIGRISKLRAQDPPRRQKAGTAGKPSRRGRL